MFLTIRSSSSSTDARWTGPSTTVWSGLFLRPACKIDLTKRPFVVVDPRAGHGPGIGGFKADSEIGVALNAGHPCYFVGFSPDPMPGQTIDDIARAEAKFLEKVIELHPVAEGKPCVIGNCQAGWAVMMLAAIRPELFGPIIIAGSPLSYWAGVRGKNPMRYTGGLTGGSWVTALTSDLGGGKFDGAWLVQNFENQNPSNTLWSKQHNLYSKVDTEAPRYLEFERWWGGHVNLNAEEIQFIVDELFVGNNLATGRIQTSDGRTIDLRNIRSPIVVFCSKGDNVTPPQQALGWILDLYQDVDEIRSHGQTIVYAIHESAGHLGIFVSGGVARKEHSEFSSNIDLIDVLPPGLYEAVFQAKSSDVINQNLASGEWIMRCETRTLDDIRALGGNDAEDERRFAAAAHGFGNQSCDVSYVRTAVRARIGDIPGSGIRAAHASVAHAVRAVLGVQTRSWRGLKPRQGRPAKTAPPPRRTICWCEMQEDASQQIVKASRCVARHGRNVFPKSAFLSTYGSPFLQAAVGIDPKDGGRQRAGKDPLHYQLVEQRIAELKSRVSDGGLREATVRALLYVGMTRGAVDERAFETIRRIRQSKDLTPLPISGFKELVREQYFMLLIEPSPRLPLSPRCWRLRFALRCPRLRTDRSR